MDATSNSFNVVKVQAGAKIQLLRKNKGISQATLGKCAGIEKAAISRIETGQSNPTVITLFKICKCLNVSLTDIFSKE